MAYLDVRDPAASSGTPFLLTRTARVPAVSTEPASFERQEWEVIVLAQRDGLASLREPSRLARALGVLFGGTISRKLADPRLETLRRLSVLAWHHGYAVPVSAIKAFKAAGFSVDQLELLLSNVSNSRIARGSVR